MITSGIKKKGLKVLCFRPTLCSTSAGLLTVWGSWLELSSSPWTRRNWGRCVATRATGSSVRSSCRKTSWRSVPVQGQSLTSNAETRILQGNFSGFGLSLGQSKSVNIGILRFSLFMFLKKKSKASWSVFVCVSVLRWSQATASWGRSWKSGRSRRSQTAMGTSINSRTYWGIMYIFTLYIYYS